MVSKIKLAICDDLAPLCHYYENAFSDDPEIDFVGMAHNARDCVTLISKTLPDVLLLDIQMETYDAGINIIPEIKAICPDIRIIMLTIHNESDKIFRAFTLGACGYQLKSAPFPELMKTIKNSMDNTVAFQPEIAEIFMNECKKISSQNVSLLYMLDLITKLTKTEMEILHDINDGLSYKDIAKKRYVEDITIRSQISRLLKKFELTSIDELRDTLSQIKFNQLFHLK